MDKITINDVETHINKWFGNNWSNQPSAQIYAMVIDLLAKVKVEVVSNEDQQNENDLNIFENQSPEQ